MPLASICKLKATTTKLTAKEHFELSRLDRQPLIFLRVYEQTILPGLDYGYVVDHRIQFIKLYSTKLDLMVHSALQSHFSRSNEKKRIWMNDFF